MRFCENWYWSKSNKTKNSYLTWETFFQFSFFCGCLIIDRKSIQYSNKINKFEPLFDFFMPSLFENIGKQNKTKHETRLLSPLFAVKTSWKEIKMKTNAAVAFYEINEFVVICRGKIRWMLCVCVCWKLEKFFISTHLPD